MRNSSWHKTLTGLLLVVVLVVAACGGDDKKDKNEDSASSSSDVTPVTMQFSWVDTIEFSGFYAAEKEGLYQDAGLSVQLVPGGFDENGSYISPIQRVVDGEADFGIASGDQLLLARANGQPVVAVASIYQRSPVTVFSMASSNIVRPQDLVGKRIGTEPGTTTELAYRALLAATGIAPDEVTEIPQVEYTMVPLIDGEIDARTGFITNEPVTMRQEGYDINTILTSDYGIELYSNALFTSEDIIANHPDMVEQFLRATFKGWDSAIANPEYAAELSVARAPDLVLENEKISMEISLPLLQPAGSNVGAMDPAVWAFTYQTLLDQEMLTGTLDINQAYTLDFLDRIYP